MSGWNFKLKDVNPGFDPIPAGNYTFNLLGANENKFEPGAIDVKVAISSEGPSQGRVTFVRYPNPDRLSFSPKALKRLEESIGIPIEEAEDGDGLQGKISYLNRVAKDGAKFTGTMRERTYQNKTTGEDVTTSELQLFSVGPAA